jgi:hypothetical protein
MFSQMAMVIASLVIVVMSVSRTKFRFSSLCFSQFWHITSSDIRTKSEIFPLHFSEILLIIGSSQAVIMSTIRTKS